MSNHSSPLALQLQRPRMAQAQPHQLYRCRIYPILPKELGEHADSSISTQWRRRSSDSVTTVRENSHADYASWWSFLAGLGASPLSGLLNRAFFLERTDMDSYS